MVVHFTYFTMTVYILTYLGFINHQFTYEYDVDSQNQMPLSLIIDNYLLKKKVLLIGLFTYEVSDVVMIDKRA